MAVDYGNIVPDGYGDGAGWREVRRVPFRHGQLFVDLEVGFSQKTMVIVISAC